MDKQLPEPGTIADTVTRLARWGRLALEGLARVEFDSEFARQRVVQELRTDFHEAEIPFHEIELPARTPAVQVVRDLMARFQNLKPGVVSLSGFATAFPEDVSLVDSLRVLNFNRENLALHPLRQIWWMPHAFADLFLQSVPDLDSWFILRLSLTETVPPPSQTRLTLETPERVYANIEDARRRAAGLTARFDKALEAGAPLEELRRLADSAVNTLLEARTEKEARELNVTLARRIAEAGMSSVGNNLAVEDKPAADFLISYNSVDRNWAEWIAWTLEDAGYTTKIQAWDFGPGSNFVLEMQKAAGQCKRTIAVLSPNYLSSRFTAAEWAAAFAADPSGNARKLVPVRVAPCELPGLLRAITYIDLVDLDEAAARHKLLAGLKVDRAKPSTEPIFPDASAIANIPAFPGALPSVWNVPARNPIFTGREDILEALHKRFRKHTHVALSGLGGMGKTQTAIEYTHRHKEEYRAVLWANADTRDALVSSYAVFASLLDLPQKNESDQNVMVVAVRRWLQGRDDWLLVLDNADDLEMAKEFFPSGGEGHILLTTRMQSTGTIARPVRLDQLEPYEGALLLLRRTDRIAEDTALDAAVEDDRQAALAISREVDGLPLALDQAGAYIAATFSTPAEYLYLYRREGIALRAQRGEAGLHEHAPVTTTFSLAFKQVEERSHAAADLLRLCAFLAPDAIPEEILTEGAAGLGSDLGPVAASDLLRGKAIAEAGRYSLLTRDPETRTLSMHRVVQEVLKDTMDAASRRLWTERTVRAVNRAFPNPDFFNWPVCARLLPHALACASRIAEEKLDFDEAARLLNQVGGYLSQRGYYWMAEPLYKLAIEVRQRVLGLEHPDTLTSLNNLAFLYSQQGRYSEAEPLFKQSLYVRQRILGPEHPNTLTILNNLASMYDIQGRYSEAEPLFKQVLEVRQRVLGPEHPDTLASLNNLASVYQSQQRHSEAEPLYRQAIELSQRILGPEHPNTLASLNNLASLLSDQRRYVEAEPLFKQALELSQRILGPEHPNTLASLNNLANLLSDQRRYVEAEPLYKQAIEIGQRILGPEHPETVTWLNNLAVMFRRQCRYAEAEPLYKQITQLAERTFGSEHPHTATLYENYAKLLSTMNRKEEAAEMSARAHTIRIKRGEVQPSDQDE